MADIRVKVDDDFIEPLRELLGLKSNADVVQEALTLLNWAADETLGRDRVILSSNRDGERMERLAMRILNRPAAEPKATPAVRRMRATLDKP